MYIYFSLAPCFATGGHSPRLIEAAQTLFSLAAHSLRQHPNGIMKWPKKSLQKPMKARKTKSNERPEHISATKSVVVSDYASKNTEQITPSKKPKLCATEKKKDFGHSSARKGLINWSTTPRSIRSSPSKSVRDPTGDSNHHNASITKQSCMLPPPTRILDKAGNSQQKPKRPGPVEWSRAGDKLDWSSSSFDMEASFLLTIVVNLLIRDSWAITKTSWFVYIMLHLELDWCKGFHLRRGE